MKVSRSVRWLLLALAVTLIPAPSSASVFISVGFAPPPLLVYQQPLCPGPGMIWTPGYWAYGPDGYYWVPGAWVPAPFAGALWTPGYWGWNGGMYFWHPGYWGYHVGYYGGINYGFGYFGIGFLGGRWHDGYFDYNRAVWRVDSRYVHHTYYDHNNWDRHFVDRGSRAAFNGGPGGIRHDPDRQELAYSHEQHFQRTSFQRQHVDTAMRDRNAYYNVNHGRPQNVASRQPLGRDSRPAPQARPMNQPQDRNISGRNSFEGNRSQAAPQNRPQYRQPQQQPQYRQQQYRPQQQPQYRQQQRPQYRQQPQPRNENRGRPAGRPQQDNRGHSR